ncbi:CYTH domain-containing protein [Salinicola sp. JS01]|uniref:CYTH domain-containing protein n=1 Tax=Salinicola sp. JS01 TaxID=3050071 RepID=UPI00255BC4AF|nr:CYTH domain-containing protein [Salinicola sp. JS01]WIX31899.1 CYTH domain-containing protein [Salinicola sp. JS01]
MSDEIELKLALAESAPAALAAHPLLSTLASATNTLGNCYYDTPDGALEAARVALRVRRIGDKRVQTLKSAAASHGGLSSRGEWEWPLGERVCNAVGLDETGLRELEHPALAGVDLTQLRPAFTTDFERRTWRFREGEAEIEIALDQGEIHADGATLPIRELELELKAGPPEALWRLADTLCQPVGAGGTPLAARPANHSKASRAGALRHGWPRPPAHAPEASLDTLIEALDVWQDSGDPAWLRCAQTRLAALATQSSHPALAALSTPLSGGEMPWESTAWLTLRSR